MRIYLARQWIYAQASNLQVGKELGTDILEHPHITRDAREPEHVPTAAIELQDLCFQATAMALGTDQEARHLPAVDAV